MAEDEDLASKSEQISDDILPHVYEGGFKTWECAIDLARFIIDRDIVGNSSDLHVVELGAGTAIPSLAALRVWQNSPRSRLWMTLADFNAPVLELASGPNVFLSQSEAQHPACGDVEVNIECLKEWQQRMQESAIDVAFVSGAWSPTMASLIQLRAPAAKELLILASETVYSPESIPAFTLVLSMLLKSVRGAAHAFIALKRVYFGVGGGLDEFVRCLEQHDLHSSIVWDSGSTGINRIILKIKT